MLNLKDGTAMASRRNRRGGYIEPFALAGRVPREPFPEALVKWALASPIVLVGIPIAVVIAVALLF